MTLIYRAVWNDPAHHAIRVLEDEFKSWCISKGFDPDLIPHRGGLTVGDKTLDIRRGLAEFGQVYRATLKELGEGGRWWTTTAIGIYEAAGSTYWVDLDCDVEPGGRTPMAAPRLVRQVLNEEGEAGRGPVPLAARPFVERGVEAAGELVALICDPERDLPVVVFSPDDRASVAENDSRARAAAETLAGIASVHLLSPQASVAFNSGLVDGFKVFGGAVRVYMPNFNMDDEADALRHRFFPVYSFNRHPRRAGQLIAARLAALQIWPDPPAAWDRLRSLVLRPTEQEIADRVSEMAQASDVDPANAGQLAKEVDDLRELLVVAEAERDAVQAEKTAELARLKLRIEALEGEHIDDLAELEDREQMVASLLANLRAINEASTSSVVLAEHVVEDPDAADLIPSTAIAFARERLLRVQIHPDAEQHVDELDEAMKSRLWGNGTWQGLRALEQYAVDVASGRDVGNFKTWCLTTGAYSVRKVATSESTTVRTGDLGHSRVLPIDADVDPAGRITMLWHLKIQEGGGQIIPRCTSTTTPAGSRARFTSASTARTT
ncbi:MAG: hypothetical protein Q7V57_00920 [Actinomycetota bacterium]|nr:hypothetical protein [Actinomycetota bacterium]